MLLSEEKLRLCIRRAILEQQSLPVGPDGESPGKDYVQGSREENLAKFGGLTSTSSNQKDDADKNFKKMKEIIDRNYAYAKDFYTRKLYSNDMANKIREKINNQDINFYIEFIVNSLFEANKYFNDQEPWNKKDNQLRLNTIVYTTLEIVRKICFMLYPIIPQTSLNALKIFDIKEKEINFSTIDNHSFLKKDKKINKIDILFKKIEKKSE